MKSLSFQEGSLVTQHQIGVFLIVVMRKEPRQAPMLLYLAFLNGYNVVGITSVSDSS